MLDMLDKSENKFEDMIIILEYIYVNYIVCIDGEYLVVIKIKVFGGDLFINEWVYLV